MKTLLKIVLLCSFLTISSFAVRYEMSQSNYIIKSIAYEISQNLPMRVDDLVTLHSVSGENLYLQFKGYFSEHNYDKSGMANKLIKDFDFEELNLLKSKFITQTQKMQLIQFCMNPRIKQILDNGIDFKYSYYFEGRRTLIGQTSITSKDCRTKK